MSENRYIAIIGDLRDSRDIEDRNSVQIKLRKVLRDINTEYAEDIAAEFEIVLGDSFQGLIRGKHALEIIYKIRIALLSEASIRFGVGVDRISTDILNKNSMEADGPAYYRARYAIEYLETNENKNKNVPADIYVSCGLEDSDKMLLLNTVLEMMSVLEMSWTDKQTTAVYDMLMHHDGQMKTAERMQTKQSNISRFLLKSNYYAYEKAYMNLERIIDGLCDI